MRLEQCRGGEGLGLELVLPLAREATVCEGGGKDSLCCHLSSEKSSYQDMSGYSRSRMSSCIRNGKGKGGL